MKTTLGLAGIAQAKKTLIEKMKKRQLICLKKSKELTDEAERLCADIFSLSESLKKEETPELPFQEPK